jgi:hypothetical protein
MALLVLELDLVVELHPVEHQFQPLVGVEVAEDSSAVGTTERQPHQLALSRLVGNRHLPNPTLLRQLFPCPLFFLDPEPSLRLLLLAATSDLLHLAVGLVLLVDLVAFLVALGEVNFLFLLLLVEDAVGPGHVVAELDEDVAVTLEEVASLVRPTSQ